VPSVQPTASPTTAAPSHPGELICGDSIQGEYNGEDVEIEVRMPYDGDMFVDLIESDFEIGSIIAYDSEGEQMDGLFEEGGLTVQDLTHNGDYIFRFRGVEGVEKGTFSLQISCSSDAPTKSPTSEPTDEPTDSPSADPSASPSTDPSAAPTAEPTDEPSADPSASPSADPTAAPSTEPTSSPTSEPSADPSAAPTTSEPTVVPSPMPTDIPSEWEAPPTTTTTAAPTTSSPTTSSPTTATPTTAEPTASPTTAAPTTAEPTAFPSSSPSTPAPLHEGELVCGDEVRGDLNDDRLKFEVRMDVEGDMTFDASCSDFEITSLYPLNVEQEGDINGDGSMTLVNLNAGLDVIVMMDAAPGTFGEWCVVIECETASPTTAAPTTVSPTTASPTTTAPTTAAPTTSSPTSAAPTTAEPTVSPSAEPSAEPTDAPTDEPSADPSASPTSAAPTTAAPTTSAPTTADPTTAAPTTSEPTTSAPTSAAPTTQSPTAPMVECDAMSCRSGCDSYYALCLETPGCAWDSSDSLCGSTDGMQEASCCIAASDVEPTTLAPSPAPTFPQCATNDALNIAFLLDESGSVSEEEWSVITTFVDRVATYDVAGPSYVSLFEYASLPAYTQFLEWTSLETGGAQISRSLGRNPYNEDGLTYTWDAVNRVLDEFYDYRQTCTDGCDTRQDMMFLLTDGTPTDTVCDQMIERVNKSNVDIIIVGIGADADTWMDEVACLDYKDDGADIFYVTEFDSDGFNAIEGLIREKTCNGQNPAGPSDRSGEPWVYEDGSIGLGPVPTGNPDVTERPKDDTPSPIDDGTVVDQGTESGTGAANAFEGTQAGFGITDPEETLGENQTWVTALIAAGLIALVVVAGVVFKKSMSRPRRKVSKSTSEVELPTTPASPCSMMSLPSPSLDNTLQRDTELDTGVFARAGPWGAGDIV